MQLYKKVLIPNLPIIQEKLLSAIPVDISKLKENWAVVINQSTIDSIPELREFINDNNLEFDIGRFFITLPNNDIVIHIDGNDQNPKHLAINIPVLGCKNTSMNWWDELGEGGVFSTEKYGSNVEFFKSASKKIASLELTQPYMVRVDVPHNVSNPTSMHRIILSLRFKPEPIDLWNSLS